MSEITPLRGPKKANYGIDAPYACFLHLGMGGGLLLAGIPLIALDIQAAVGYALVMSGGAMFPTGVVMLLSSLYFKIKYVEHLLDKVQWTGGEQVRQKTPPQRNKINAAQSRQVLDVGCGHGLFLIKAAKRLTRGKAVGVDLWSNVDQLDNRAENTKGNALAGLCSYCAPARVESATTMSRRGCGGSRGADRRRCATSPVRRRPLRRGGVQLPWFTTSVSGRIATARYKRSYVGEPPPRTKRSRDATRKARVLKPGGTVIVLDISYVGQYEMVLKRCGVEANASKCVPLFCMATRACYWFQTRIVQQSVSAIGSKDGWHRGSVVCCIIAAIYRLRRNPSKLRGGILSRHSINS